LGFTERVNVLERETVQIYKKRLFQFHGIEKYLKSKYPHLDEFENEFIEDFIGDDDIANLFRIPPDLTRSPNDNKDLTAMIKNVDLK
jgi:hypothetical protein